MPFTVNRYLEVPVTGSLPGTWGEDAVNPNMVSVDGLLGGFATISLSSATTFALGLPSGAATGLTPGAGPSQSENALLKFTGTLTGNAVVQFTMPGFYIVHNACTVGAFYIQLAPSSGGGNTIGAPPGQKVHVFFDGTDMDYIDSPPVGSALDLHQSTTSLPAWMGACTVAPYLVKNGATHAMATYPALGAMLGSTFGGNGSSHFGVPDELSRVRLPVDTSGSAGRVTSAISGISGTTLGAAGGSQSLQTHSHTVTDPGHVHDTQFGSTAAGVGSAFGALDNTLGSDFSPNTLSATIGITTTNATGAGSSQNMMPVIVSFIPLIKT